MKIVIGNKLYSSWSMRPWLVLKAFGVPFEEEIILLDAPSAKARREAFAPSPTVPILVDGDLALWETLAIIEYLADRFPDRAIWPREPRARAMARVVSSEMHAGYASLRKACPMNLGKRFATRDRGIEAAVDIARVDWLMSETRAAFGAGGAYLFGDYCAADAMFTPIATRFETYALPASAATSKYFNALLAHPAYRDWLDEALVEPWTVPFDEVGEEPVAVLRKSPTG
ncbi:MAG: glutathione S-transferase [Rhizobiales bacterium]|nr:glutathione S-transferase [Hyphomicrobiales bacterium]